MKILEGRRLAAVFAAYIGIFSAYVLLSDIRKHIIWIGILIFLLFALNLFLRTKGQKFSVRKAFVLLLMVVSIVAACVRGADYVGKTDVTARSYADGEVHRAEGFVTRIIYEEIYGSAYEIRLFTLDETETELLLLLTIPQAEELSLGDLVRFEGEMLELTDSYEFYQKADGIFLASETESVQVVGVAKTGGRVFFETVRSAIRRNFEKYLKKETFGMANALMTGNRGALDGATSLAYTRLGISHLLAVSGLHLSIIVGGLDFLLKRVLIPKKIRSFVLIGSAFFFAGVCGFTASVVRAAIMLTLFYVSDMVGERHDSTTALFFAIFAIVLFRPNAVYDVGMWLSFLATLGILSVLPVFSVFSVSHKSKFYILGRIGFYFISILGMSLAATFFTLPIVCLAFGGISLISPIANLIFIPLTQLLLYLLMLLTVVSWFPWLSFHIGGLVDDLSSFSLDLAQRLSDARNIYISLRYPFVQYLLLGLTVGILAVLLIKKLRPAWMFAVFLTFVIAFGVGYGQYERVNRDVSFVYLETDGKSDAIGFFSRGGSAVVDISTGGSAVYRELSGRLSYFCEAELDVLVLTHYHVYHAGTIRKLMDRVKIHQILLPEPKTENEMAYFDQICAAVSGNAEIVIYQTDGNSALSIGEITLRLPKREYSARSSHPIVCFSADIGENGKGFAYLGEGATETDFSDAVHSVTVIGAHGPVIKHIFDAEPLERAELVIFSEKSAADWSELDEIAEKTVYAEDYGGYIRIMFE